MSKKHPTYKWRGRRFRDANKLGEHIMSIWPKVIVGQDADFFLVHNATMTGQPSRFRKYITPTGHVIVSAKVIKDE